MDKSTFLIGEGLLQKELLRMTDRHTELLFELPGADRLFFPVSRLVVDPERFRDDADEPMASRGMGAFYTKTHDGFPLKRAEDREEFLRRYYDPHHAALDRWAARAVAQHGRALIVDCHSFPTEPLPCDFDQATPRPDMCIGTDPVHTPSALSAWLRKALEAEGWTVAIDRPYAGTLVPAGASGKDRRVVSVMVEVRRGLYMDEATGSRLTGFGTLRSRLTRVLFGLQAEYEKSTT